MNCASRASETVTGYRSWPRVQRHAPRRAGWRVCVAAVAAGPLALATPAGASGPGHGRGHPPVAVVRPLELMPMPAGGARLGRDPGGHLTVQLAVFGLTPGSAHTVGLLRPGGSGAVTWLGAVTASPVGQADASLDSTDTGRIPAGSRLVILNGSSGAAASEPIAQTSRLIGGVSRQAATFTAVEAGPAGTSYGTPAGRATIAYDAGAHTLTVTVQASGLTPGNHAAHIHLGSCASQGPVQYMLADLAADSRGMIVNETRVISGVTAPIPASGWYLNIHQGDSGTILRNGQPTIAFRPLLCSDV